MDNITNFLRDTHDTTIRQQKDWHFFSFLGNYVKFIKETPEISTIIEPIKTTKKQKVKEIMEAEKEAVAELINLKDALLKEIKNKKVVCDGLPEALLKLKDYENGKMASAFYQSTRLKIGIDYVLKVLPDSKLWIKKYNTYTEKFIERGALNTSFDDKKKTELWGIWDKLNILFVVLSHEEGSWVKGLEETGIDLETFEMLRAEMRIIRDEKYESGSPISPELIKPSSLSDAKDIEVIEDIEEFKRDDYVFYLDSIHLYILKEATTKEKTGKKNLKIITLCLNKSGELYRDKYCYGMDEKSDRCKIVRFLADGEYKETKIIADELDGKNKNTLRIEMGKIKNNVETKLKCKNFFQGKKGSGYKINPKYKIILKD